MTLSATLTSHLRFQHDALTSRGVGYFMRDDACFFLHRGPDALDLMHRLTTNDLLSMHPGGARRTVMTNEIGRIIDVFWVAMMAEDELLLLCDSEDPLHLQRAILKYTIIEDACLHDLKGKRHRITMVGEGAPETIASIGIGSHSDAELSSGKLGAVVGDIGSDTDLWALRSDSIGYPTWELIGDADTIAKVVAELRKSKVPQLSMEMLHSIRIANGIPWPGKDLNQRVNPLEAGLMELIDFEKGCYVGQEVIARLDSYDKVQRQLVSIDAEAISAADSRDSESKIKEDATLTDAETGRKIGWVSSLSHHHMHGRMIGLGYVRNEYVNRTLSLAA